MAPFCRHSFITHHFQKRREVPSLSSSRRSSISERSGRSRGSARRLYDGELTRALYDDSSHKIATGPGRHVDPLVPDLDLRPRSSRGQGDSPRSGRRGRLPKVVKVAEPVAEVHDKEKVVSRKRAREDGPTAEPEKRAKKAKSGWFWFLTDNFLVGTFLNLKEKLFQRWA